MAEGRPAGEIWNDGIDFYEYGVPETDTDE
jgi:hypothetical protein